MLIPWRVLTLNHHFLRGGKAVRSVTSTVFLRERPTSLPPDEPTTPRRHRVEVRKAAAEAERQAVKITPMAVTRSKSIFGGKMLGGKGLRKLGNS